MTASTFAPGKPRKYLPIHIPHISSCQTWTPSIVKGSIIIYVVHISLHTQPLSSPPFYASHLFGLWHKHKYHYSNDIPLFCNGFLLKGKYQNCPSMQASPPCNTMAAYHDNTTSFKPSTGLGADGSQYEQWKDLLWFSYFGKEKQCYFFSSS